MPFWLLLVPIIFFSAGMILLVRGLRGRATDDHPICRRCGFDLIGLPDGVKMCSECGADISAPNTIRTGHRRRRPGVAVTGLVLMAPLLVFLGAIGWGAINDVRWIEQAPYWYVLRQSKSVVPADRDQALLELNRRISANELSARQLDSLMDTALASQADVNTPWVVGRGDLIENAHAAGKLPAEKWKQYLSNAPQFKLVARPQIRRGDELVLRIVETGARCGSRSSISAFTQMQVDPSSDLIAKDNHSGGRYGSGRLSSNAGGSTGRDLKLDRALLAGAADGPKKLALALRVDLYDGTTAGASDSSLPPTVTKVIPLQTTWELVPADAHTVKPIDDPAARPGVEKSIEVREISAPSPTNSYVNLYIHFDRPPVPISHKLILRAPDGREWPIGGVYVQANTSSGWGVGGSVKGFDCNTVDVILRPDLKTALGSVEMTAYWTGEVTVKNVPVKWPSTRAGSGAGRSVK